ncbi:MAG: hypothetical protein CMF43_04630 [Legionellales bacterium]|nr:hypothetical protein [Legionellales bacterium]
MLSRSLFFLVNVVAICWPNGIYADSNAQYRFSSQAFLYQLLLPDDAVDSNGDPESFVTYVRNALIDRDPSNLTYNYYDGYNLFQMGQYSKLLRTTRGGYLAGRFFQGYVSPSFPDDTYFTYEIARGLMGSSQSLFAQYQSDQPDSATFSSDDTVQTIRYVPPTVPEGLQGILTNTPANTVSRQYATIASQYGLEQLSDGSDYDVIGAVQNNIRFSLMGLISCAGSFLPNQALPCKVQVSQTTSGPVTYKDITNSSCTMRATYVDQPWNGMKPMVGSLRQILDRIQSSSFEATIPSTVLTSTSYIEHKRGVSCLVGNMEKLLSNGGNWYNFFHWSTFTDNPECKQLLLDSGQKVPTQTQGITSMLYAYLLDDSSSSTANVNMDAINVVRLIDGYINSASTQARLAVDPTRSIMQALIIVLHRFDLIIQAQAARASVNVVEPLAQEADTQQTILPDASYLLYFFLNNYVPKQLDPGESCRYSGLNNTLSVPDNFGVSPLLSFQENIIFDVVGMPSLASPLVGFTLPTPPLTTVEYDGGTIDPSRQAIFLKFGRFSLGARYQSSGGGQISGTLIPEGSGQTQPIFNIARLLDQIQENQKEVTPMLRDQLKSYNQNMQKLVMIRMMIAYVYEYYAVSTQSAWSLSQNQNVQTSAQTNAQTSAQTFSCTLSESNQLLISSTWRTDPVNSLLAEIISNPPSTTTSSSSGTSSTTSSQSTTTSQSTPSSDSDYQAFQSTLEKMVIQYARSMTQWNSLDTLRDEAFELAKRLYMGHLKSKIRELNLVFKAAMISQQMANGHTLQKAFPQQYANHDANTTSFLQVNSVPSTGTSSDYTSSDGSPDISSVQPSTTPTMQSMVDDATTTSCPNTD